MRSGWFWQTPMWEEYQTHYHIDRPRVEEYKSSPLDDDHDFTQAADFDLVEHRTQVLDLRIPQDLLWRDVRKSYRPLITKAQLSYEFRIGTVEDFHQLHRMASGRETRAQGTWDCMQDWLKIGFGGIVAAYTHELMVSGAYFIIYKDCAYYASGASLHDSIQHAVIWTAIKQLKVSGIYHLELGQLDGENEKERNIGMFKKGFGGKSVPFTIARRKAS